LSIVFHYHKVQYNSHYHEQHNLCNILQGVILNNSDNQDVLAHVAYNMKRLRAEQQLTQHALAERSGISRRMVAAIENGSSNISLAKLAHIATALGVGFATIVSPSESKDGARGNILTWRGVNPLSEARLSCSLSTPATVELWVWKIAPFDHYLAQPDPHGWFEMIHVIEGKLTLKFSERSEVVHAGESTVYNSDQHYGYYNDSDEMLVFIRNAVG
jgi:transcriptional regulator with XRE-family HTH domain